MAKSIRLEPWAGDPKPDLSPYYGQTIVAVTMTEEEITISFGNGSIKLYDDGQCCCEFRYMRTDDDVQSLVGAMLTRIEIKDGPSDGDHEQQFLEITTDKGFVTIANHNEHNGYYGGFSLVLEELSPINTSL